MPEQNKGGGIPARQFQRYSSTYDLSVTYEGTAEEITVRPPDLSVQGMFINTPTYFPVGAVLKLRFRLGRSGYQVTTRAEVRYCLEGVGLGVEFVDLPVAARDAIQEEIEGTASVRSAAFESAN